MMRVTPLRLITLQCSQIGCTLLRTFTVAPNSGPNNIRAPEPERPKNWVSLLIYDTWPTSGNPAGPLDYWMVVASLSGR
jgi:hypothetical protein